MTTAQFFEKFDLIADAPDAVARMREIVFQLMVAGRLIPDALERPVEEDTKLMGTVVELVMGQAPAGHECNSEGQGTVFVKVGEFGALYPCEEVWTTNPLKFAKKGDVLVCVVGATVGKLNLAIDCAIGRSVAAIRPSAALDSKFLYYSLIPYTLRLRRNSRGSAQGVIGKAELNAISLWVPSGEVQKRIVAKVDELMALCDQLEAQQQEHETKHTALVQATLTRFAEAPTPTNLNLLFHSSFSIQPSDLRKTILTLAVQGKLVPQDTNEEPTPAESVMKSKAGTLADGMGLRSAKEAAKICDEPFNIPASWKWCALTHLGAAQTGSTPSKNDKLAFGGSVPFIKPADITSDAVDYLNESLSAHGAQTGSRLAPAGSLLMVCIGTIGKCNLISRECAFNQQINSLTPIGDVHSRYLLAAARADYFQKLAWAKSSSTTIAILNKGKWLTIPVPVPPLAEQKRIVAKVEELMALVDALEAQQAAADQAATHLLDAVVSELAAAA